jgi:hypothetical protein
MATNDNPPPSQTKPTTPPPPYTDFPDIPSSTPSPPAPSPLPLNFAPPSTQPLFGPTPLTYQQTLLLPYYDPRSPYSIELAARRTRWRFIGAVVFAVFIWLCVGVIAAFGAGAYKYRWYAVI